MRIALLEDDPGQIEILTSWLNGAGHECNVFSFGQEFINAVANEQFDLFILDCELPDISGKVVLGKMRSFCRVRGPIVFLSARYSEDDVSQVLHSGADVYLVKPIAELELLARIESVMRRAWPRGPRDDTFAIGDFKIDQTNHTIKRLGLIIDLTPTECDLALHFFRNVEQLLSREVLLEKVWGLKASVNTRRIDVHCASLRRKLNLTPENGWRLISVYRHGYRLERVPGEPPPSGESRADVRQL